MADDPGLLALVIDDELAPRVLAYWKARPGNLARIDLRAIAKAVRASVEETEATIERCQIAGLLLEGGISTTASKWLSAYVAKQLGAKRSGKPKATAADDG